MNVLISNEALKDLKKIDNKKEMLRIYHEVSNIENKAKEYLRMKSMKVQGFESIYVLRSNLYRIFFTYTDDETVLILTVVKKTGEKIDKEVLNKLDKSRD